MSCIYIDENGTHCRGVRVAEGIVMKQGDKCVHSTIPCNLFETMGDPVETNNAISQIVVGWMRTDYGFYKHGRGAITISNTGDVMHLAPPSGKSLPGHLPVPKSVPDSMLLLEELFNPKGVLSNANSKSDSTSGARSTDADS